MELFLGITSAILILVLLGVITAVHALVRVLNKQNEVLHTAAQLNLKQIKEFEGTTTLPPNVASASCSHHWIVIKDERLSNSASAQKLITILQCDLCGTLDKTIEDVPAPVPVKVDPPKSECRHVWEKQKSVILDSAYEQMAENTPRGSVNLNDTKQKAWFFRKRYVGQRICNRCGLIDTVIASNYDLPDEFSDEK